MQGYRTRNNKNSHEWYSTIQILDSGIFQHVTVLRNFAPRDHFFHSCFLRVLIINNINKSLSSNYIISKYTISSA